MNAIGRRTRRFAMALTTVGELFRVVVTSGRWFLAPMIVVLVAAGALLAVVQVLEYVAPFVYTVF